MILARVQVRPTTQVPPHWKHFESCSSVRLLSTPHSFLLDVAHGAFSTFLWPHLLYRCVTVVHIMADGLMLVSWVLVGVTSMVSSDLTSKLRFVGHE